MSGKAREVTVDVAAEQFAYVGRDLTTRFDAGEIVLLTGPDSGRLQPVSVTVTKKDS